MAVIKIDGKEYDTEKLPKEAVDLLNSIIFVDMEVQRLQNQMKVLLAAKNFYSGELKKFLDNFENPSE